VSLAIKKLAAGMRSDLPLQEVVEHLIRSWRGPSTEYCAYAMLKAIGKLGLRELHASLSLLESVHMLQHSWIIEGPAGRLDVCDVSKVFSDNQYRHPVTGEVVTNAVLKLRLIYQPGHALNEFISAEEPNSGSSAA
jgi:hypothetical protein